MSDSTRIALVTNAQSYAGPAAMAALLKQSFEVVAHDATFTDALAREEYIATYPGAKTSSAQEPEVLISQAWERYGRLDVIVSNDSYPAIHLPIEQADVEDLRKTLEALVIFPYRLMQTAVPRLKEQGKGNVIMITSCRTELPLPGGAIPDIARDGANALMKSLSLDLAPHGIPVNAIAPNYFYSEAYFPKAKFIDDPKGRAYIEQVVPAGRLGELEEMGELITYLAEMKGSFHTGTIIKFAGGWPAAPKQQI